jgi:hypothetical protein
VEECYREIPWCHPNYVEIARSLNGAGIAKRTYALRRRVAGKGSLPLLRIFSQSETIMGSRSAIAAAHWDAKSRPYHATGRAVIRCATAALVALLAGGCGAYKAFTQPPRIDVAALKSGQLTRDVVIQRLGEPRTVTKHGDGSTTERFEFYEGSDMGWKVMRGTVHFVGALVSYGAWELAASPIEFAVRGDKLVGEAEFDRDGRLQSFLIVGRDGKRRGEQSSIN